jgi:hypothetical protein
MSLANEIGKIGQRVWRLATGKNQHTTRSSCLEEGREVMEAKHVNIECVQERLY